MLLFNQEANKIVKTSPIIVPVTRIHILITRVPIVLDIAIYGNIILLILSLLKVMLFYNNTNLI